MMELDSINTESVSVAKANTQSQSVAFEIQAIRHITTVGEYETAGELVKRGQSALKVLDEAYDSIINKAFQAHKEAVAKKAQFYNPIKAAVTSLKKLMSAYQDEEERKRKAEELRLQEEANRKAEEDKLNQAVQVDLMGEKELAEQMLDAPVEAPVIVVKKEVPKVDGVVFRTTWKGECIDLMTLAKAVVEGLVSVNAIQPNAVFINQQARALRETFKIPGCKAWSERS